MDFIEFYTLLYKNSKIKNFQEYLGSPIQSDVTYTPTCGVAVSDGTCCAVRIRYFAHLKSILFVIYIQKSFAASQYRRGIIWTAHPLQ